MQAFLKDPDLLGKLLPALATGLLAFIPAILSWLSNRSQVRGRNGRVAQLTAELKLLEQWLSVSRTTDPRDVQAELDAILAEYRSLRVQADVHKNQPYEITTLSRSLMLFRPLSFGGWLRSIAFWYLALILVFGFIGSFTDDPTTTTGARMGTLFGMLVVIGGILFFIRRSALRLHDTQVEARLQAEAAAAAAAAATATA